MSTDTLTTRDAWAVLRAVLETVPPGRHFSSASWHDEAVLAELKSGQIVKAQKRAVFEGYLEPVGKFIDGKWSPNMTQATHAAALGRWVALYRRTDVGQAEMPGQLTLVEVTG